MLTTILLFFLLGINWGILLTIFLLRLFKVNCPQCKQPKPLREIIIFQWKQRTIAGQSCQKCQKPKPRIDIQL